MMNLGGKYFLRSRVNAQDDPNKLQIGYIELEKKLKEMEEAFTRKREECTHIKHVLEGKVNALQLSIQELEKKQYEMLQAFQGQINHAMDELSHKLLNVENSRLDNLANFQDNLEKQHYDTKQLLDHAFVSLSNISKALVSYTWKICVYYVIPPHIL